MEFGSSGLKNIEIILVGTLQGGNIGSAARAMKNMGLSGLKLVAPSAARNEECVRMAVGAIDIVEAAPVFDTLDEALTGSHIVVGTTSGRERRQRQKVYTARELAPRIRHYALEHRVALVFGPERSGLDDQSLARCGYLVSIPADPAQQVLNLAQSVMVLAYEIFCARPAPVATPEGLVDASTREEMFAHVERALSRIGFFQSDNRAHMMKSIRRLLGRTDLNRRDVRIIRGIMSQIEWFAGDVSEGDLEKISADGRD